MADAPIPRNTEPPTEAGGGVSTAHCRVCGEGLSMPTAVVCVDCDTPTHHDCFQYAGGCSVYGCGGRRFRRYMPRGTGRLLVAAEMLSAGVGAGSGRVRAPRPNAVSGSVVEFDFHSPLESRVRWTFAVGLLGLASSVLIGAPPYQLDLGSPLALFFAIVAGVGLVGVLGLEEVYVFEKGNSFLMVERSLFGIRSRRPAMDLSGFEGVGLARGSFHEATLLLDRKAHWDACWLVLHRPKRGAVPLGDASGRMGCHTAREMERMAARVSQVTGLATRRPIQAQSEWWGREKERAFSRGLLWASCLCILAAFAWDGLGLDKVFAGFLAAMALPVVASVLNWWILQVPDRLDAPPPKPREKRGGGFVIVLAAAGLLPWLSNQIFQEARALLYFKQADCQILDSRVILHTGSKGSKSYEVRVEYQWKVGGQRFAGRCYDLAGLRCWWEWTAGRAIAGYEKGGRTTCWYDPAQPSRAVLDRTPSVVVFLSLLLCLVALRGGSDWLLARSRPPPK